MGDQQVAMPRTMTNALTGLAMALFTLSPFSGFTQSFSQRSFQSLFSYDTTLIIVPKKVKSVSSHPNFYVSGNGLDLWVGQNVGHGAKRITLIQANNLSDITLKVPKNISKFTQKWPPHAVYVDSSYILVNYYNMALLYQWKPYPQDVKLVQAIELRHHAKSSYQNGRLITISDYELASLNGNRHHLDQYTIVNGQLVADTTADESYLLDLPEYCVFGSNLRYLKIADGIVHCNVGAPWVVYDHSNQQDTFWLNARSEWHYPDMNRMDSLRGLPIQHGYQAQFWLKHLRDVQLHHSKIDALEQINDSLILVRWYQPNSPEVCTSPNEKCPRGKDRYELIDLKNKRVLPLAGNFYEIRKDPTTPLTRQNVSFRCLTSCRNGIWHNGFGYEVIWSSPVYPLGMTYGNFKQANETWLSKNQPVIRINRFRFNGVHE